jgi:hypothetical protein
MGRTLGEPDCIEALRQLGHVLKLLCDEFHLVVDISVLFVILCKQRTAVGTATGRSPSPERT